MFLVSCLRKQDPVISFKVFFEGRAFGTANTNILDELYSQFELSVKASP